MTFTNKQKLEGVQSNPSASVMGVSQVEMKRTPEGEHNQYEQTAPLKVTTKLNIKVNITELLVYNSYFPYDLKGKCVKQHLYCSYLC